MTKITDAELDIEIEDLGFSITPERVVIPRMSRPPKPKPHGATVKISIRVPTRTLLAVKDIAVSTGVRYQTLINAELRRAIAGCAKGLTSPDA